LHPNFSFGLANFWSGKSRVSNASPNHFLGEEQEWLVQFCKKTLTNAHYDCFIFGHRHLPIDFQITESNSRYINLGDWIRYNTYAEISESGILLKSFEIDSQIFGSTK
jgi:UDP-2,3-diacylglucosamine hydrolase